MADISKLDDISKLQSYEDYIANNITEWEAESIARICRKIGKIGKMSKKELEKFDADKEAKKEWERIVAALAIVTALNIRTLKEAYISEFDAWEKQNEYLYQYRGKKPLGVKNEALHSIIEEAAKNNAKEILNLTNTKALSVLDGNGNPIRFQDAIYKSFGDAVKTVTEGKADFYTTMRQTVQNLGGGGCRVNYGGGVTRRLDTVVRQNIAYGVKQSHKEYNALVGREIGADGIEIDYHSNSRPSHRYMQGKQYSKGEGKTVNGIYYPSAEKEGVYDRLYEDYNCRHYETDIILGVSEPRYSAKELRRLEERDKRLYKIGNIEKDGYGWSQSMRAIETDIRKSKDEINALKSFGNSEPRIKELQNRIKTFQAKYDEISDVTGIAKENRRLTVQKPQNVLTSDKNHNIINEAEKNLSELGIFKNKNELGKNMNDEYYSMVKEKFSHGSDVAKKVFNKFVPPNSTSEYNRLGDAIYDTTTKKISLNYMADLNNPRGNGITYFHEHAHLIDDFAGRPSRNDDFLLLLEEDKTDYMKLVLETQKISSAEEFNSFMSQELNDMRKHSGVSDIYDGLTLGEIRGITYHPISYWEEVGNIEAEAFAHMFEAEFDNIKYREMKKYFPKSFEWFENKLKEMAK